MPPTPAEPDDAVASLDSRRVAIAAALRAVRDEPGRPPRPAGARTTSAPPATTAVESSLAVLQSEVRRLTDRLDRLEDTVELIREDEEAPLSWPVAVGEPDRLEVPPIDVSRKNSPAFDVLLGPDGTRS